MQSSSYAQWVEALQARHLTSLTLPEVARALRALSSAYVERRHRLSASLDGDGKRAAFALYYAPLHYLAVAHAVRALGLAAPAPAGILDLGCGTGAAGAAWALTAGGSSAVHGLDKHPWAVDEARWTLRTLGVSGSAARGDVDRWRMPGRGEGLVAAYVLNELPGEKRSHVETLLLAAGARGVRVLVIEPLARAAAPWWDRFAERARAAGGRVDEWRAEVDLPAPVRQLGLAAGLRPSELRFRSLLIDSTTRGTGPGTSPPPR